MTIHLYGFCVLVHYSAKHYYEYQLSKHPALRHYI